MPHYQRLLTIATLGILLSTQTVWAADTVRNGYTYHDNGLIEHIKKSVLFLQSNSLDGSVESKLDLKSLNTEPPTECYDQTVACEESTEITVITKKVWTPVKLGSILDEKLDPATFAKYFPKLNENQTISNGSRQPDKLIAQRALYEAGLLNSLPTGKFGYQTELAVIKLQCLKGIEEYDTKKKIAIMGPKTIKEINAIKAKLRDPTYFDKNPLPTVNLGKCAKNLSARAATINTLLASPLPASTSNPVDAKSAAKSIKAVAPKSVNFDGQVIIKKQQ